MPPSSVLGWTFYFFFKVSFEKHPSPLSSHTSKCVIPRLVTVLTTSGAVTLAGVDVDAEPVAHNGDELCRAKMEAKGRWGNSREPTSRVLEAKGRQSCQISSISLLELIQKEGLVVEIDFDAGSLLRFSIIEHNWYYLNPKARSTSKERHTWLPWDVI